MSDDMNPRTIIVRDDMEGIRNAIKILSEKLVLLEKNNKRHIKIEDEEDNKEVTQQQLPIPLPSVNPVHMTPPTPMYYHVYHPSHQLPPIISSSPFLPPPSSVPEDNSRLVNYDRVQTSSNTENNSRVRNYDRVRNHDRKIKSSNKRKSPASNFQQSSKKSSKLNKKLACKFFNLESGCHNGEYCHYSHPKKTCYAHVMYLLSCEVKHVRARQEIQKHISYDDMDIIVQSKSCIYGSGCEYSHRTNLQEFFQKYYNIRSDPYQLYVYKFIRAYKDMCGI